LRKEFLRGAVVGDGLLVSGSDQDADVAGLVKVVFVSENLTGKLNFLARVPL